MRSPAGGSLDKAKDEGSMLAVTGGSRAARKGYLVTRGLARLCSGKTGRDCEGRKAEVGHSQVQERPQEA